MRSQLTVAIAAAGALALAGCSSSSDTATDAAKGAASSAAAAVEGAASAAASAGSAASSAAAGAASAASSAGAAAGAAVAGLPQPPAGSQVLDQETENGVKYARYSNANEQAAGVVSYYTQLWQGEGYTVNGSGGGGGGWGQYGGSGAGAEGSKEGSYVAVQAGGQNSGPVYFEVCVGPNQQAVDNCQNLSQDNDNDSSD